MLCPLLSRQQVDPSTGKSEWTHMECLRAECMFYNVPEADCQFLLASRDGNVQLPSAGDWPDGEKVDDASESSKGILELLGSLKDSLESLERRQSEMQEALKKRDEDASDEPDEQQQALESIDEKLKIVDSAQQEGLNILRAFREVISSLPSRHEELAERFSSTLEEALKEQTQAVGSRLADEVKAFGSEQKEQLANLGEDGVRSSGRLLQAIKKNREEQQADMAGLNPRLEEMERSARKGQEMLESITGSLEELRAVTERGPERLDSLEKQIDKTTEATHALEASAGERSKALAGQVETMGHSLAQMALVVKALQEGIERANSNLSTVRAENKKLVLAFHEQKMANQEDRTRRQTEQARELNNKGVALFHRGSIEAAIEAFIRAVELKPDHAEAYNNLGLAYSKRGQNEESVKYFQKALELDPQMGEVYNNLGFLFHTTSNYDRAIEMFNHSLQTGADQAIAFTNLGNSFYQLKQNDKAVAAWRKAIEIDPLNETARRGLAMFQQEPTAPAPSGS
ncbi:MAG: tetratricopeptide repeat protein [Acidobacteria bacterium]|nr:tetratricopeptide repeat protein [Acidobacteriota bacterium]